MSERIRVLVADDSPFVRRAVERMLAPVPEIEIVGDAATGEEAIELTKRLRPDVVILDVNMPEMDGLEALRTIMSEAPTGVLMLSTMTSEGARTTIKALELGAVDFLDKSAVGTVMDIYALAPQLREKVLAVAGAVVPGPRSEAEAQATEETRAVAIPPAVAAAATTCPYDVIVIGASTGGPRALSEVLAHLPEGLGSGVVVAQHMPAGFTETLADRLDRRSPLRVREASDRDEVVPGQVLVCPGGAHVTLARKQGRLLARIDSGPTDLLYRPSVDRLFNSAAEVCGPRTVGVVLTGMGDDGSRGLAAIRAAGGRTIAESESTAVIFGMPRAAAKAAERVVPLPQVAPGLVALCAQLPGARED